MVVVAKNYLSEKEIRSLERNVSAYFDYVERLLEDEMPLNMKDFASTIDEFLKFNRYEILEGHGQISNNTAKQKAIGEYKEFNKHQKIVSDFDREIKRIQEEQIPIELLTASVLSQIVTFAITGNTLKVIKKSIILI